MASSLLSRSTIDPSCEFPSSCCSRLPSRTSQGLLSSAAGRLPRAARSSRSSRSEGREGMEGMEEREGREGREGGAWANLGGQVVRARAQ